MSPKQNTDREGAEKVLEFLLALAGLTIGVLVAIDQLQDRRSVIWSVLIVLLVIAAFVIMYTALVWYGSGNVRRRYALVATGMLLVLSLALLIVTPTSHGSVSQDDQPSDHSSAPPSPSPAQPAGDVGQGKLLSLVTSPDESNTCDDASMIVAPGHDNGKSAKPGHYALVPGAQMSVILQADTNTDIVVTRVRTVVDDRTAPFTGTTVDISPDCQGEPDERFYRPDLSRDSADIRPDPKHRPTAARLPLTVSSQDPVILYLSIPPVTGAVHWHLELTCVSLGQSQIVNIYDSHDSFIASVPKR